tara:strand:- start:2059 stop:5028 length:2970 start_codon:yes stop_codon:yes gene_type:complete
MEYKNKYLKYKNKYYDFVIDKKMEGGNPLINIPIGIGIAGIVGYISNKLFCNSNEIEEYLKKLSNILNLKTDTLLKLTNIVDVIKKSELKVILELIDGLLKEEPGIREAIIQKYSENKDILENDPFLKLLQDETLFRNFIDEMNAVLEHGDMGRCLSQDDYSLLESKLLNITERLRVTLFDLNKKNEALSDRNNELRTKQEQFHVQELEISDLKNQLETNNQNIIALEAEFKRKNKERDSALAKSKEDMLTNIAQREAEMKQDIEQREAEMKQDMDEREATMLDNIKEKEELSRKYLEDLESLKRIDLEKSVLLEEQILRNRTLESEVKSKEKEIIDSNMGKWMLKGKIRGNEKKLDKSKEEMDSIQADLSSTKDDLKRKERELFSTKEVLSKTESNLEESRIKNIDLTKQFGLDRWKAKGKIRQQKEKLLDSDDLLKETKSKLAESSEAIDSANIKLMIAEDELDQSERENRQRLQDLIETQKSLDKTGDELFSTNEELSKTKSDLEKSKRDSADLIKKSGLEMWKAKGNERKYKDEIKRVSNQLFDAQEALSQTQSTLSDTESELEYSDNLLSFTQEELAKSINKNNSMRIRDNTKLWMMRNKLNSYMNELDKTNNNLDNTEMQLRTYLFELNDSNRKRDILQEDLEEVIQNNNNLDTSNQELKKEKVKLDDDISEIKNELEAISEDYENAVEQSLELIDNLSNKDIVISDLEKELQEKTQEIDSLTEKVSQKQKKIDKLAKLQKDLAEQFKENPKKTLEKTRNEGDLLVVPASPSSEDKLTEGLQAITDELTAASETAKEELGRSLPIKNAWMSDEEKTAEKNIIQGILNNENENELDKYLAEKLNYGPEHLKRLSLKDKIKHLQDYLRLNFSEIKKFWQKRIDDSVSGMQGGEGLFDKELNNLIRVLINKVKYNSNVSISEYNKKLLRKINKKLKNKVIDNNYINTVKLLNNKMFKLLSNEKLSNNEKNMKLRKYLTKEYKATIN